MAAVSARVSDRRVLRLIRGYLRAGVLDVHIPVIVIGDSSRR
jgi:hypothetical protein